MKTTTKKELRPLAQGQLWKMGESRLEIISVGKTLTHYRIYQNQKRVPISLAAIKTVQDYLKTNGARLVKSTPIVAKPVRA